MLSLFINICSKKIWKKNLENFEQIFEIHNINMLSFVQFKGGNYIVYYLKVL